ncbi:FtsK/SpoIIIE domain-containing protein [Photobacterium damselae]|uniref:FtsK/SpoIIIE domain-containing protein n=1 Tax=Photobacterium damselae TaxID=38293 RepID=UPI0040687B64
MGNKKSSYRGADNNVINNKVDTSTHFQRLKKKFNKNTISFIVSTSLCASFVPSVQSHAELFASGSLALAASYLIRRKFRQIEMPFEKPFYSDRKSAGFFYFGNQVGTKKEIWLSDSEARRHILIFGTTGAGKSEALIGLITNALAQNSAFLYVDGKADTSLYAKIFSLVRRWGRCDDLLTVNYMLATLKADVKRDKKLSNTMNPFSNATAEALSELITSLLPSSGDGIWKDRASSYISALIRALVEKRDQGKLLLDVGVIRSYFQLEKTIELSKSTDISPSSTAGLRAYVLNLPAYQPDKKVIESTVYEQHGYVVMQFQPCFGMLADSYGHVMKTQLADCDFVDIVVQARCLVVLLPALEKSPANLANLGKIIISSVRGMMAGALGAELEGKTEFTIDSKPTNGRTYQCVFDEFGYYSVEGSAVMPAQARGIGFSLCFSGQDYQAFKKSSAEEAASIKANCATKLAMCLEDAEETADIFVKGAGKTNVEVYTGLEKETSTFGSKYIRKKDIHIENIDKVNLLDLKGQGAGEYHFLNMDRVIRGFSFYANPPIPPEVRVNSFIKVQPPSDSEIRLINSSLKNLEIRFKDILAGRASKPDSKWNTYVSDDIRDFSNNITRLNADKSDLVKVAFAMATRKNHVDIIDNQLVLKIKEYEQVVNQQQVDPHDIFDNQVEYTESPMENLCNMSQKDAEKAITDRIDKNDQFIMSNIDLNRSPLAALDLDMNDSDDIFMNLSYEIIEYWDKHNVLSEDVLIMNKNIQAKLAHLASQGIVINSTISEFEDSVEIDTIDNFNFDIKDIEDEFNDDY